MAAGAAPVLLLGGLRGAAVAAARGGARRGAADVPRKAPDGAGLGGSADPAAELPEVAPELPRLGVVQPGVAGVAQQPPGAAPSSRAAAGRHGRSGRLPLGTLCRGARHLLGAEPRSAPPASPPPTAPQRGGKSACDQTQEEI